MKRRFFSRRAVRFPGRRGALIAAAFAGVLAAQACSTQAGDPVPGALRTGTYPNLNIPPEKAADQISPQEARAETSGLVARRDAIAAEGAANTPARDAERLRQLGESHGQRTIEEIEQMEN